MNYISVALDIPVFKNFYYSSDENVSVGSRVKVPFGKTIRIGYVLEILKSPPPNALKEINSIVDETPLLTPQLMKLADDMSNYYVASAGNVLSSILPPYIKPLKRVKKEIKFKDGIKKKIEPGFILTDDQHYAIEPLLKCVRQNSSGKFLLHGVTDSGKTEIYIHLISEIIARGKQAIMLVPEISITAQLINWFEKRFTPERVAVWHSRISPGKRATYLKQIQDGGLDILIGPRSCVFAPFPNLGTIIIDEEQDASYKEDNSPHYDARWVAGRRTEIENAVLLLSSATPSVETYYLAKREKINYIKISRKIHRSDSPEVIIVDMKQERQIRPKSGIFSKYMLDEISRIFQAKRQSIIFINRRGFSTSIVCRECGENLKCSNCNISFVYHSSRSKVSCHWCGRWMGVPEKCPACGGKLFAYEGVGTQRVESILNKIFPDARVARMDMDTTLKKGSYEKLFDEFSRGKYDILVGTQIISKGWDFTTVDLIGVIASDTALMMPDFRASEKVYNLLKQLEGRSGRGSERGKIIVQTYNPGHYVMKMICGGDYEKFYEEEINIRKTADFPPFSSLINIVSSHKKESIAKKNIEYVRDYIADSKDIVVLGPAQAARYKLRGNFRWQMLIKHSKKSIIKKVLLEMLKKKSFTGRLKIDVDPQNML